MDPGCSSSSGVRRQVGPEVPWPELAALWRQASAAPVYVADETVVGAMVAIRDLIGAAYGLFFFGMLEPASSLRTSLEAVSGWRPCGFLRDPDEPAERIAFRTGWIADLGYQEDPGTRAMVETAGSPRANTQQELASAGWEGSPSHQLLQRLGVSSRLLVAIPISPRLEAVMGFDRNEPDPVFDDLEKRIALRAAEGLVPQLVALARLFGFERHEPLTNRERELLRWLLTGASERQVAAQAGLTWRSAHRRVVDIYRKLGVTTRAELMARFLVGWDAAGSGEQEH